jgi:hypothetical protein
VSYILMNELTDLWNWSWLVRTGYPQGGRVLLGGSIIKTAFLKKIGTVPRPQCPALVSRALWRSKLRCRRPNFGGSQAGGRPCAVLGRHCHPFKLPVGHPESTVRFFVDIPQ